MMSDQKSGKYVVVHPKLFMVCGGVSECQEAGSILKDLTDSQVKRLGSKIKPYVPATEVDVNAKAETEAKKK